jgi:hypothetical protein
MTQKYLKLVAVLACLASSNANAETFTFESQMDGPPMSVGGARPDGSSYGGSYFTGTSQGITSAGGKTKSKYACVSMTTPPTDSIFKMHSICDVTTAEGDYTAVFGCDILAATEVSCVGGIYGKTGVYKGRRGSITNHGKGPKSSGTGQWIN